MAGGLVNRVSRYRFNSPASHCAMSYPSVEVERLRLNALEDQNSIT